jgi:hypothetical protein
MLFLALATSVAWVRSHSFTEDWSTKTANGTLMAESAAGTMAIAWVATPDMYGDVLPTYSRGDARSYPNIDFTVAVVHKQFAGVHLIQGYGHRKSLTSVIVPDFYFVAAFLLPPILALLRSACDAGAVSGMRKRQRHAGRIATDEHGFTQMNSI